MSPTQQFDSYLFSEEFLKDACRGVAEAVAQTRAAGLKVEGYASNPVKLEAGEHPAEFRPKPAE